MFSVSIRYLKPSLKIQDSQRELGPASRSLLLGSKAHSAYARIGIASEPRHEAAEHLDPKPKTQNP